MQSHKKVLFLLFRGREDKSVVYQLTTHCKQIRLGREEREILLMSHVFVF